MLRPAALVLVALLLSSCIKAGVNDAVEAATSAENQERINALVGNEGLKEALQGLGKAIVLGSLDGLSDEERNEKIQASTGAFVTALAPIIARELETHLGPTVEAQLKRAVDAAIAQALSQENRRNAAGFASAIVSALTSTFGQQLEEKLGPSLRIVIEANIGPAIGGAIENDIGPGIEGALIKHVLPPIDDVIDQQRDDFAQALADAINQGQSTANRLLWGFGIVSACLGVIALGGARRIQARGKELRALRDEAARRERTVILLARQIHAHAGGVEVQRLLRSIKQASQSSEEGDYLSHLLKDRKFKVEVDSLPSEEQIAG